jgi:DNA-binding winged helix-turn-helix (wHTH) protein
MSRQQQWSVRVVAVPMPSFSSDVYDFGPCRLDAGQRVLTREHQRIPLPPKTFDLLLLLVQSPGRAFSKQELMTALWPDTFVEEGNLSFQISTLRKALGDGASEWIERVPRYGYRFAAEVIASRHVATLPAASQSEPVPAPAQPLERSDPIATPLTAYPALKPTPASLRTATRWPSRGTDPDSTTSTST